MKYHDPVLLKPSVDALDIVPDGTYVDLTFGGGGHSAEILSRLKHGRLFGFDQDHAVLENQLNDARFQFIMANFRYVTNFLRYYDALPVDGVLADLGISSRQIDHDVRGFSFRWDTPLDMRMNQQANQTAADIVNDYGQDALLRMFREYGEIKSPVSFVNHLVKSRQQQAIKTTGDLAKIASDHVLPAKRNKFLAQVFQALRIELNQEMQALEEMLLQMANVIRPGGKLVVLSYHSLEDRMVKNIIRSGNLEGKINKDFYGNIESPFQQITRKPIVADAKEIEKNPRARSVKMRVAERK
jgi:16S rRNA (cytosine1402-N4)-methyltransferase